jgi:hypothetical protein
MLTKRSRDERAPGGRRHQSLGPRLHDASNRFVSDGSVFASSAAPNPTLTIVALAIRQAEHIAGAMARREL